MSGYKETYWQFDYYYAVVTKEKVMLKSQMFFGCCNLVGCIVDSNVNGNIHASFVHYADYEQLVVPLRNCDMNPLRIQSACRNSDNLGILQLLSS
jgi:hypothetical protein